MTFRNQPLDNRIADGATGGPEFITIIAESESGREERDRMRLGALGRWDVSYAARREQLWQPLRAHFLVVGGRADTWPFRDPLDHECSAAEAVLGAIDSTHWQMMKRYSIGAFSYDKKIVLPYNSTIAGTGTYTVDGTTGIIHKTSGADPTGFSTSFYKLVRYDTDRMVPRAVSHKPDGTKIVEWAAIPIREVMG